MSQLKRIARWVVLVHAAILCWICVDGFWRFTPPPRAIAVRQVRSAPPPKAAPARVASAHAVPQRKAAPVAPKAAPAPISVKKAAPKPAVATKAAKPAPAQKKEEIQLPTLIATRPAPIALPAAIDAPVQEDVKYEAELALFLEGALVLPEQGEVEAELNITPNGELVSCRILSSKSKKNEEFLKKKLPNLFYPCFHGSSAVTVTVIFCNEDLLKY